MPGRARDEARGAPVARARPLARAFRPPRRSPQAPPPLPRHRSPSLDPTTTPGSPLPLALRFAGFALLLLTVGAATFRLRIVPAARAAGGTGAGLGAAERAAARTLTLGAGALAALTALQLLALEGAGGSAAGRLEGAATALLVAGAGAVWLRRPEAGWRVGAVAAAFLCLVPALEGHALEAPRLRWLAVASDGIHVGAGGAWLGSLAVLLLALPGVVRASPEGRADAARLARAFSPVALVGAATVVLTGVVRSLFHVTSAAELWRTVYGNTLTFKVGVALLVLLAGLYNWRRVLPRLGTRRGEDALRRTATLELLFAVVVLLLTAVLVALPLP